MIVLGIILLAVGLLTDIGILTTLGVILAVVGAILALIGTTGRAVGGRPPLVLTRRRGGSARSRVADDADPTAGTRLAGAT